MNEPTAPEATEPMPLPCCQYCGKPVEVPALYNWTHQQGPLTQIILAVYCPNIECRKILGTQMIMAAAAPPAEEQHSRIHRA